MSKRVSLNHLEINDYVFWLHLRYREIVYSFHVLQKAFWRLLRGTSCFFVKLGVPLRSPWEAFWDVRRPQAASPCLKRPPVGFLEALPVFHKANQKPPGRPEMQESCMQPLHISDLPEVSERHIQFFIKPELPFRSLWISPKHDRRHFYHIWEVQWEYGSELTLSQTDKEDLSV